MHLVRQSKELGESFILIKDSEPISAIIPFDEYESMLETLDILESEPDIAKKLKKTAMEMAKGKYHKWPSPASKRKK